MTTTSCFRTNICTHNIWNHWINILKQFLEPHSMDQRYINPPIEMPNIMLEIEGFNLDKYTIVDKSTIWIQPPIVPICNNIWECITLITTQRIFWSREQFSRNIASEWIQQLNPSPPQYWKDTHQSSHNWNLNQSYLQIDIKLLYSTSTYPTPTTRPSYHPQPTGTPPLPTQKRRHLGTLGHTKSIIWGGVGYTHPIHPQSTLEAIH